MVILKVSAVLLFGAVSSVAAQPVRDESTERTSYTRRNRARPANGEWFALTTPTPAKHGIEYITIDPENSRCSQLRLATTTGRVEVRTVRIDYTDGTNRFVRLDRQVTKGRPALIDLRGAKSIRQIVVNTERWGTGLYTLEGIMTIRPNAGV